MGKKKKKEKDGPRMGKLWRMMAESNKGELIIFTVTFSRLFHTV